MLPKDYLPMRIMERASALAGVTKSWLPANVKIVDARSLGSASR
jgi:hypothetical protein